MPLPVSIAYCRQSHGSKRSVEEQEDAARETSGGAGWDLQTVYVDLVGASRFTSQPRPDWDRLLADLPARRPHVMIMWESSRGDRTPETWLAMLSLCRRLSVRIHVITHQRTYDMTVARDWRTLAEEGIDSAYESEKSSLRIRRDLQANAVNGRPHAGPKYGYRRIYSEADGSLLRVEEEPGQAAVIRDSIFGRLDAGVPLSTLERDLTGGPELSPGGKSRWHRSVIRGIALDASYIGKRPAGVKRHKAGGPPPELYDAIWPAIVDEAVFWSVSRRLTDPARKTTRPGRQKWLLSYLAECGRCGAHVNVQVNRKRGQLHQYTCVAAKCVTMNMEWLDEAITALTLEQLAQPSLYAGLVIPGDSEIIAARAAVDELKARLDEHARMSARGLITPRSLAIAEAELLPQIAAAGRHAERIAVPVPLRAYRDAGADVAARWEAVTIPARREVISALFTHIRIMPARPGVPRYLFDPERISYEWA